MCGRLDIVGTKGNSCWGYTEAAIVINFAGVKFRNDKEEFIVSGTLGEGHVICKCDTGELVLRL